jgi:NADH-quinone oxidoreductase subunit L
MFELLKFIPALPLLGFLVLLFIEPISRRTIAAIGVGSVAVAMILAILVGVQFIFSPPADHAYTQTLWTWFNIADFSPEIALRLDALSLIMVLVVTIIGFFIHLYSSEFMADDEGYRRFFAYMNLFVGSMLILVLADNLLFLYLGWEGVGLCSYLLIGFWYDDPANGRAARKAFIVTRLSDTTLMIGLFFLFTTLGTLQIQQILDRAAQQWSIGSSMATTAALLLLAGAIGKSAQLPLQVWLPDAMAGPTPVSALIHAATMVTAGVYLIARTHVIFSLAPNVQFLVAVIGAVTLLVAGISGMMQQDIKRVLAYSTISQIGYMFLALGVGAWSAAIFHFMTHAFFKSLLFLGAGVVILSLRHEHNLFRMGGLRKELPVAFWTFFVGSLTLAGLPPTAGFSSKDLILAQVWTLGQGGPVLWTMGVVGVLLTSIYTFRMFFLIFFGPIQQTPSRPSGIRIKFTLITLAVFCFLLAGINWSTAMGGNLWLRGFLRPAFPEASVVHSSVTMELILELIFVLTSLAGVFISYLLFLRNRAWIHSIVKNSIGSFLYNLGFSGWGFDRLYEVVFVQPYIRVAQINRNDVIDWFYRRIEPLSRWLYDLLSRTQTGHIRWYATGVVFGVIVILAIVVLL